MRRRGVTFETLFSPPLCQLGAGVAARVGRKSPDPLGDHDDCLRAPTLRENPPQSVAREMA